VKTNSDDFFDRLYRSNYSGLVKYAYRLTYEKNIAEEIVQDAFIEAYKRLDLLKQHENPIGWLYITVRNISKAYLREYRDIKQNLPLHEYDGSVVDSASQEQILRDLLSEDEVKIMLKFYEEHCTISEIAHEYKISISACKMRLKRARDKLKKEFSKNLKMHVTF
jgi:RNA polymerase sigma factor (sigma-70 family)